MTAPEWKISELLEVIGDLYMQTLEDIEVVTVSTKAMDVSVDKAEAKILRNAIEMEKKISRDLRAEKNALTNSIDELAQKLKVADEDRTVLRAKLKEVTSAPVDSPVEASQEGHYVQDLKKIRNLTKQLEEARKDLEYVRAVSKGQAQQIVELSKTVQHFRDEHAAAAERAEVAEAAAESASTRAVPSADPVETDVNSWSNVKRHIDRALANFDEDSEKALRALRAASNFVAKKLKENS